MVENCKKYQVKYVNQKEKRQASVLGKLREEHYSLKTELENEIKIISSFIVGRACCFEAKLQGSV